jgi:pimeloyl-ACP methyl ester carboxylesterase
MAERAFEPRRLKAPGATLYCEVRGSGPLLVMIPGGPTDAGIFAGLATRLADRYTVVAYDPRGNSRSTFDGAPEAQQMDVHGDDAALAIQSFGDEPAYVFGSSGGAQIGLNLVARHGGRVRMLVAHEPPCLHALADPSDALAGMEAVHDTYCREGEGPAMQRFMALAGISGGPPEVAPGGHAPPADIDEALARIQGNLDYFLAYGVKPISFYFPDIAALRAGPARIVVGVGEDSEGQLAHRTAIALAAMLATEPVACPGDHTGYASRPDAFAEILHRVLRG